jgi:Ca-activated chloride channel family protein
MSRFHGCCSAWRALRLSVLLLVFVGACEAIAQTGALPGGQPTQIYLTVSGAHGTSADLAASDLTVTVGKQNVAANSLEPATNEKLSVALLVDMSSSSAAEGSSIKAAASQIFQALSSGDNQGYLVLINQNVAIDRSPLTVSAALNALSQAQFAGGTALYDAIDRTCSGLRGGQSNVEPSRRVVVLLSEGDDNQSHITAEDAAKAAEAHGVAIFAGGVPSDRDRGGQILMLLSQKTGGRASLKGDMARAVPDLLAGIRDQWKLSISVVGAQDGALQALHVKTSQKGIQISAPADIVVLSAIR